MHSALGDTITSKARYTRANRGFDKMSTTPSIPPLRVLVGLDLTERSQAAFARACELAQASNGTLSLLHVISDALPGRLREDHESYGKEALDTYALRARAKGVAHIDQSMPCGREYEQLIELVKSGGADLVVLGRHRPSSVLQDMLGTTVDRVLRLGGVPVLLARTGKEGPYKNILVAVDFSPASRRALQQTIRWFPAAQITVIHAYGSPRRLLADAAARKSIAETHRLALKGFIDEVGNALGPDYAGAVASITSVVEHGWAEDVVLGRADATKPDLVVLGTHARSGIGHALLGSVAEVVLLEAPCDVMAVPPAN
jgi:nucleotide-binding universal stress UspA family protein